MLQNGFIFTFTISIFLHPKKLFKFRDHRQNLSELTFVLT